MQGTVGALNGNVPKKLGSYNKDCIVDLSSHKNGNVPKKLGSYNI